MCLGVQRDVARRQPNRVDSAVYPGRDVTEPCCVQTFELLGRCCKEYPLDMSV
jgi:hypothetical protein